MMFLRILKYVFGIICLLVGLFALVTPLTPGAWLILVGMELLGLTFLLPKRILGPWLIFRAKLLSWIGVRKPD